MEEAKLRGPLVLTTRDRAVTAADYEQIARSAAPELARVRCTAPEDSAGVVCVLVVPEVLDGPGGPWRLDPEQRAAYDQIAGESIRRSIDQASASPARASGVSIEEIVTESA